MGACQGVMWKGHLADLESFTPGGGGGILFRWSVKIKIIKKVPLIVIEIIFQYRSYSVLLVGFESRFLQIKWFDVFCCIVIHGKMFLKPPQLTHCCLTVIGASCCQVFHLPPRITYHHVTGIAGGIFGWVGVDSEGRSSFLTFSWEPHKSWHSQCNSQGC